MRQKLLRILLSRNRLRKRLLAVINVDRDSGHAIENVVYFELLRRGYDVSMVTESMTSEDVRKRELAPLQKINDNYEKIVLSMNTGMDSSYDGIKSINLIDWLILE